MTVAIYNSLKNDSDGKYKIIKFNKMPLVYVMQIFLCHPFAAKWAELGVVLKQCPISICPMFRKIYLSLHTKKIASTLSSGPNMFVQ